ARILYRLARLDGSVLANDLLQARTVDELHRDVQRAVRCLAEVVHRHDVRMFQSGRGARFALEARNDFVRGDELVPDHFYGDGLVEHDVPRAIDRAHAPGVDERVDAILPVEQ